MESLLLLLGLAVVGGFYWRAQARATELLAENARILAHLRAKTPSLPTTRQPLGERLSADARGAYERAIGRWRRLSARERAVLGWIEVRDGVEWEEVRDWEELSVGGLDQEPSPEDVGGALSRTREILSDLREALRSTAYDTGLVARASTQDEWVKEVLDFARVVHVAGVHAVYELGAGSVEDALDLRVLQAAAGQDLARLGTQLAFVFGHAGSLDGLGGIREILAARPIGAARLAQLAREAAFLDSTRAPRARVWYAQEIAMRMAHDELGAREDRLPVDVGSRYWFSHRIAAAEATAEIAELVRASRATSTLDWRAGANAMEKLIDQVGRHANPYARSLLANEAFVHHVAGRLAIQTNLLRVSVAVNAYEAKNGTWPGVLADLVPEYLSELPRCPYAGTPVRLGEDRVWSDGGDGDDDGGKPQESDLDPREDGDVVWLLRPAE